MPHEVAEVMLLDQIEQPLSSAYLPTDKEPLWVRCEEECPDNLPGPTRCEGTLTVTGQVVAQGVAGDLDLQPSASAEPRD